MPPRKERVPVVLDTNVVIAYYLSTSGRSASRRIFHLWREIRRALHEESQPEPQPQPEPVIGVEKTEQIRAWAGARAGAG